VHGEAEMWRVVRALAAEIGVDPVELHREALDLADTCRRLGLRNRDERLAYLAEEAGIPVEAIAAEFDALGAVMGASR
jgi:hypothetical protein